MDQTEQQQDAGCWWPGSAPDACLCWKATTVIVLRIPHIAVVVVDPRWYSRSIQPMGVPARSHRPALIKDRYSCHPRGGGDDDDRTTSGVPSFAGRGTAYSEKTIAGARWALWYLLRPESVITGGDGDTRNSRTAAETAPLPGRS